MIDEKEQLREVAWNEVFRWLVLLRSVRIALLARVLVLGALGLTATTLGWWGIVSAFAASNDPVLVEWRTFVSQWLWNSTPEFSIISSARSADELFEAAAIGLAEAPVTLWLYLIRPFVDLFQSELTPVGFLCLVLCGVWELFVWGLFGGAITRIAALKFTRDEAPDLWGALRHSGSKILSYSSAPLLAFAGAAVFGVQLAVLGWVMRLSVLALVAGVIWPFVLLLGLLMAILLIGALAGWPLMWATVSVEGTDAFDALSRSYAYTYQRPLRLLWYVLLATILAAVSMFIVKLFATTAISLGNWSVSWGLDDPTYRAVVSPRPAPAEVYDPVDLPPLADGADTVGDPGEPNAEGTTTAATTDAVAASGELQGLWRLTAVAIAFWKSLLGALAAGYQAGFLWVAAVGVYLLLRKDIDGAEMDEVYVEDEQDFGMPPLADDSLTGIPEINPDAPARPGDMGFPPNPPDGDAS